MTRPEDTAARPPRLESLDFAKGLAILAIFLHHFARSALNQVQGRYPKILQWTFQPPGDIYAPLGAALAPFDPAVFVTTLFAVFGYIGVHVFVVASGFGLAYGLQERPDVRWASFLVRRFRKLLPPFVIAVVGYGVLQGLLGFKEGWGDVAESIFRKVTLVFVLNREWIFDDNSPLWFVGLIVPLYLIFPMLYGRATKPHAWRWFALFVVVATGTRAMLAQQTFASWHPYFGHAFFLTRVPEFFLGIVLGRRAAAGDRLEVDRRMLATGGAALLVAAGATLSATLYPLIDPALGVLASVVTVLLWRLGRRASPGTVRAVAWVGVLSYFVYLVHRPLITMAFRYRLLPVGTGWSGAAGLAATLAVTLAAAWVFAAALRVLLRPRSR